MLVRENVFVITGGPSVGKTAVLTELRKRGYTCCDEVARSLIDEQLKIKGTLVPWLNLGPFNQEVVKRMLVQHKNAEKGIHFFDRALPDNIGYLRLGNEPVFTELAQAVKKYRYNKTVFFLPPWREIYINDAVRREPFEFAVKIGGHIKSAYVECDYTIVSVPQASVAARVEFILDQVQKVQKK